MEKKKKKTKAVSPFLLGWNGSCNVFLLETKKKKKRKKQKKKEAGRYFFDGRKRKAGRLDAISRSG